MTSPEEKLQSMMELSKSCQEKKDMSEFLSKYAESHGENDKPTDSVIHISARNTYLEIEQAFIDVRIKSSERQESTFDDNGEPVAVPKDQLNKSRAELLASLEDFWNGSFTHIQNALSVSLDGIDVSDKEQRSKSWCILAPKLASGLQYIQDKIKEAKALPDESFYDDFAKIVDEIDQSLSKLGYSVGGTASEDGVEAA